MAHRFNAIRIQMLSSALHKQIFGNETPINTESVKRSIEHLKKQNLWGKTTSVLEDVDLQLPPLLGNNVEEHFQQIGENYCRLYRKLLHELLSATLPVKPKSWKLFPGWTCYDGKKSYPVDYPKEDGLILDVEVCQKDPTCPTLATALSSKHWYSWCSERLVSIDAMDWSWRVSGPSDLISIEDPTCQTEKLIIGHNVSYDRAFLREQYLLQGTKLRFLDTLSLHMCISGLTGVQRAMSVVNKSARKQEKPLNGFEKAAFLWLDVSSLNNLHDVHSLYCPDDEPVHKDPRDVFVKGNLTDIRNRFQELMTYCAKDVEATYQVVQKIMPLFLERFPHPVSLAGMLEMSVAYLPVNEQWERYLRDSQEAYEDLQKEQKMILGTLAQEACALLHDNKYLDDPWMWNLDWSVQQLKIRKTKAKKTKKELETEPETPASHIDDQEDDENFSSVDPKIASILKTSEQLYKVRPHMPGYPAWYRDLCIKFKKMDGENIQSGPTKISTQVRQMPKLMRLTWEGNPLHYEKDHGWGYLVPVSKSSLLTSSETVDGKPAFPLSNMLKLYTSDNAASADVDGKKKEIEDDVEALLANYSLSSPLGDAFEEGGLWREAMNREKKDTVESSYGPYDVGIPGCLFYRLPHKDGPSKRVGNPLSKDFLQSISDGILKAEGGQAQRALVLSKMASYWRNAQKRILSQMVVWLENESLPKQVTSDPNFQAHKKYGAILPRLIVAGTVTRRAVEPTWLTASNAYKDRVGSELKAMIQSPPGYHFVGADVDAQELWIAALLGDAHFAGMHGSTAFGWMTLQGDKASRTDLHSRTADAISITRDQAKVLNYGRIYGAGQPFATRLLMQFNHKLTLDQAREKARVMYSQTKGNRRFPPKVFHDEEDIPEVILQSEEQQHFRKKIWVGGSESDMFNCLESIAKSNAPTTPVLGCRISRALEPSSVDNNFLTSRVNWVVQSSAVDYLHLMLVCMHWLTKNHGVDSHFSLSIHDEVRFLVASPDRYRAALCLQITNILVRSLFSFKLGMGDLPQSVAFFSAVDIDVCLRKEVDADCQTPSCPRGLHKGYNIPSGEKLDIHQLIKITGNQLKRS